MSSVTKTKMIAEAFQINQTPPEEKKKKLREADISAQSQVSFLILAPFNSIPKLSFDNVKLGRGAVRKIVVQNPGVKPLRVSLKIPKLEQGFEVDYSDFTLKPKSETMLSVGWVPGRDGNVREKISVKYGTSSTHILLIGSCPAPPDAKKNRRLLPGAMKKPATKPAPAKPVIALPPNPVQRILGESPEMRSLTAQANDSKRPALKTLEVLQSSQQTVSWSPQKLFEAPKTPMEATSKSIDGRNMVFETFVKHDEALSFVSSTPANKESDKFKVGDISAIPSSAEVEKKSSSKELKFDREYFLPPPPSKSDLRSQNFSLQVNEKDSSELLDTQNDKENVLRRETYLKMPTIHKTPVPVNNSMDTKKAFKVSPQLKEIMTPVNVSVILEKYMDWDISTDGGTPEATLKNLKVSSQQTPSIAVTSPSDETTIIRRTTMVYENTPRKVTQLQKDTRDYEEEEEQDIDISALIQAEENKRDHSVQDASSEQEANESSVIQEMNSCFGVEYKINSSNKDDDKPRVGENGDVSHQKEGLQPEEEEEDGDKSEEKEDLGESGGTYTLSASPRNTLHLDHEYQLGQDATGVEAPRKSSPIKLSVDDSLDKLVVDCMTTIEEGEEGEGEKFGEITAQHGVVQNSPHPKPTLSGGSRSELQINSSRESGLGNSRETDALVHIVSPRQNYVHEEEKEEEEEEEEVLHASGGSLPIMPDVKNLSESLRLIIEEKDDSFVKDSSKDTYIVGESLSPRQLSPIPQTSGHISSLIVEENFFSDRKETAAINESTNEKAEALQIYSEKTTSKPEKTPKSKSSDNRSKLSSDITGISLLASTPMGKATPKSDLKVAQAFDIKISPPSIKVNKSSSSPKRNETFSKSAPVRRLQRPCPSSTVGTGLKKPRPSAVSMQRKTMLRPMKGSNSTVRHPNPFSAKNIYYDERWIQKQENGFKKWLNFILTPNFFGDDNEMTTPGKVDVAKVWSECTKNVKVPRAPTKEVLSLRTYTVRREMNRLRRNACHLWQTREVSQIMTKVEIEIEKKALMIRPDKSINKDSGMKKKFLELMLTYHPLWLQIGLETTFGEILPVDGCDLVGLSQFILTRVLSNPAVLNEYAHPSVPHHYKPGYEEVLKQFTLRKFMQIVFFLDMAKTRKIVKNDPCLFRKDSKIKMSKDILLAFSRDFLAGEGNVIRHLSFLKFEVKHKQTPLEEFDYAVSNLANDMRNGVRLCRVVELLCSGSKLSHKLRLPAMSRLQKVHNVDLALTCLKEFSRNACPEAEIVSRDIVEGNLEKTLAVLWEVIFGLQFHKILKVESLEREITVLEKSLQARVFAGDEKAKKGFAFFLQCKQRQLVTTTATSASAEHSEGWNKNRVFTLLLTWARLVASHQGIEVENLTVSFSDGRVLCYLLNHYFPTLLPIDLISEHTSLTQQTNLDGSMNDSFGAMTYSFGNSPKLFEDLLKNEKNNFKLFREKILEIGGIPFLIQASDMVNTVPDEKVTATFLAYFASRMMELATEMNAAKTIQAAWNKFADKKRKQNLSDKYATIVRQK